MAPEQARALLHAIPHSETLVSLYSEALVPTRHGLVRMVVFRERETGVEHLATVFGDVASGQVQGQGQGSGPVLARVHSECLTSEVFGSLKCDCRDQLDAAMERLAQEGRGVLLYLRQEGRGIGLGNKIRAYALQAQGADTYEANRRLGFADDLRSYAVAAQMLELLGVRSVELITNNPLKVEGLDKAGIRVARRVSLPTAANSHSANYLRTKREKTGHLLELAAPANDVPRPAAPEDA